jgi:hypothetical protein
MLVCRCWINLPLQVSDDLPSQGGQEDEGDATFRWLTTTAGRVPATQAEAAVQKKTHAVAVLRIVLAGGAS